MANQTVTRTCNPVHVHEFEWTIENVSRMPNPLKGLSFSPIPKRSEIFNFELSSSGSIDTQMTIYINLIIHVKTTFNLICDLTIMNAKDKVLKTNKNSYLPLKEYYSVQVMFLYFVNKPGRVLTREDLPEDKMILKAKLSLSGYDIVPDICVPTITNSPVGHCELAKDLKTMFENGFAHDVTFSLNGKTIPAHTAILCTRSPVFAKMFQHDMLEKRSKNIVIKDIDSTVFNTFLLFLYTGEVTRKEWIVVYHLYSVADKYEVPSLRRECSRILAQKLSIASVSTILELADLHSDAELKKTAKIFVQRNFPKVAETSGWAKFVDDNPRLASEILRSIKTL